MMAHTYLKRELSLITKQRGARYFSGSSRKYNDHLAKIFDDQKYFIEFNKTLHSKPLFRTTPQVGLFKNNHLTTPNGLIEFSKKSLIEAKNLVASMNSQFHLNQQGKLSYISKLDELSDILCRVIDVAEFIRVAHPSQKWINAAQQTHEIMFEYMNQLNTNVELYQNLKDVLNDQSLIDQLSLEEIKVGEYLKEDFERSGIHMDPTTRSNFVAITQEISLLGSQFNNELHNLESYWCELSIEEFNSIKETNLKYEINKIQSNLPKSKNSNKIYIPLTGHLPYSILFTCSNESIRSRIWIALHNSSNDQISTLNSFLKYRATLAKMLGYKSFAHYQLEHKMSKTPENVISFLQNLQKNLKNKNGGVIDEIKKLYELKNDKTCNDSNEIFNDIKPWDRDFLLAKLQSKTNQNLSTLPDISKYLSVGTIINGLNQLFQKIYNIELKPIPTSRGETWDHNQVRKIEVFNKSTNKEMGYLYLDFWSAKVLPSHFTITCSRLLDPYQTDSNEKLEKMKNLVHVDSNNEKQLPVISLVCNFAKPQQLSIGRFAGVDRTTPTLLSLDQVDTIFHEMGHAMHSMIGSTNLHNLSGTRCLTDFVELPSVLMEFFSKDPRVLCKIAKHYELGEHLPIDLLNQYQNHRIILDQCETYMQSKMAMLDQVLHGEQVVDFLNHQLFDKFDSTSIYHQVEKNLQVFADQWSTWHGKFPHLFSYGAVYYSYLLDRAIADKVWSTLFATDPWCQNAGLKYKESILKWGGTKDPWDCLADALNDPSISKGDSNAMITIGENI